MGFEDKVEQSFGRPCRQSDGRFKRTCALTSSIVPRGTSFHHAVELEFPPIAFDPVGPSCRYSLPGRAELGAVNHEDSGAVAVFSLPAHEINIYAGFSPALFAGFSVWHRACSVQGERGLSPCPLYSPKMG